ncbi:GrpB domain protein [Colletotrichum scovillei]|nr:GrpB domain protein [Colletotrichum scovillei]
MDPERGPGNAPGVPKSDRGLKIAIIAVTLSSKIAHIATDILTLPYNRFYQQNTLLPILAIAKAVEDRESDEEISAQLKRWRDRKLSEFQLVQVASTLISAAVIGCFSWPPPDSLHWLSPAFWHASISFSLFSILLAASEQFIFQTLHRSPTPRNVDKDLAMILYIRRSRTVEPVHSPLEEVPPIPQIRAIKIKKKGGWIPKEMPFVEVRWNMIFTWQAPMMLMAYSAICFLGGLTVYVCAPLYDGQGWVGASKAAVFYLVSFFLCGITFICVLSDICHKSFKKTVGKMSCSIEEIVKHYEFDPTIIQRIATRTSKPALSIEPPNPEWPQQFQDIKSLIENAIGSVAVSISHVGSTSVPNLPAKDVIDIDLAVENPTDEAAYAPALEKAGFQFLIREPEWHEHRFFAMHRPFSCNLHVFKVGTAELARHLIMKEWLIEHDDDRDLYAKTKAEAAGMSNSLGETVMEYNFRKENVIRAILERAFKAKGYLP